MGIAANRVACIVLAAGRSERYGHRDKLAAELGGKPLLHHVLSTLNGFDFAQKIVVCRPTTPDVSGKGFDRVETAVSEGLQSDSLRTGIRALHGDRLAGFLIALGDMPAVSREHVQRLLDGFQVHDLRYAIASGAGDVCGPPAVFAIGLTESLARLDGDQGARSLLLGAALIQTSPNELFDVDTPADLERASITMNTITPVQKSPTAQ
jgi:molybdenum cofactor cytidylyltransferase